MLKVSSKTLDFTFTDVLNLTFNDKGILVKHWDASTGKIHYVLIHRKGGTYDDWLENKVPSHIKKQLDNKGGSSPMTKKDFGELDFKDHVGKKIIVHEKGYGNAALGTLYEVTTSGVKILHRNGFVSGIPYSLIKSWELSNPIGESLINELKKRGLNTNLVDEIGKTFPLPYYFSFIRDPVLGVLGVEVTRPIFVNKGYILSLLLPNSKNYQINLMEDGRIEIPTGDEVMENVNISVLAERIMGVINKAAGSSSSMLEGGVPANSSPLGGIDFRAMNYLVQPMGSFKDLRFGLPTLTISALERIDLDKELDSLRNMVKAGMVPSGERVKEYLAACFQKGKIEEKQDDLLVCLAEIYRLAEEENLETSPQLRESLVIVDTGKFVLLPNNQKVGLN